MMAETPPLNPQTANVPTTYIFGIRHHGPGSARSLLTALETLQPDCILVEGPPDAADVLPLLVHADMQPPVALLIYASDQPQRAVYYPFALFSPEWQALRYGLMHGLPVRFMDLPQTFQLRAESAAPENSAPPGAEEASDVETQRRDPLAWLANAAGYSDGERWWEHMVEQRRDSSDLFAAILEAMTALREATPPDPDPNEARREAWMRQTIRAAQKEGFQRIAIVCGAWHSPALVDLSQAQADTALLKNLPKQKVQATWVPWTHGRLSYHSGYGAGVGSPGWYEHLWRTSEVGCDPTEVLTRWMVRVAKLLREQDLDASSAHVIEAVRLSEALAGLRERSLPGLDEANQACQAVFCFGSELPMHLIRDQLIVGETLGEVPSETPLAPLQQDLAREQKRLRLPAEASWRDYDLDLRKANDLDRSHLLHRLQILGIPWGEMQRSGGKGTFREVWRVQWQPELTVKLIEAGVWGNTIADAAANFIRNAADNAKELPDLTRLVDKALLADLTSVIDHLMQRLQAAAAVASDIAHLMDALPPLANVLRYGNVRKTDTSAVAAVVDGLVARICVGLPTACAALDDTAAQELYERLLAVNGAIGLLQNTDHQADWSAALQRLADLQQCHGLIAGRACRFLLDSGRFSNEETARRVGLALAQANAPTDAAAWIEGLLKDSGTLLVHDDTLWQIIDSWLATLQSDTFTQTLPLLRRTFATFAPPERRMLGERARQSGQSPRLTLQAPTSSDFDHERAATVLPLLGQLLGLNNNNETKTA